MVPFAKELDPEGSKPCEVVAALGHPLTDQFSRLGAPRFIMEGRIEPPETEGELDRQRCPLGTGGSSSGVISVS